MGKEIILSAKDLSIGYHSKGTNTSVHDHLNFSLRKGELTSLLGPNGVGKSTLMRTISALQPRLGGSLTLEGKELNEYNERERSRTIGVVLTDKAQIGGLTVNEVVALGRQPHTGFFGRLSTRDKELIESAILSVGLGIKRSSYMAELSDGERQKAMIAKALVQESPLILLDEPTAFLDAASRIEITQLLHEIATTQNRSILLSTHDIEQALILSDRLWLLTKKGLKCGTPEDLVLNHQLDSLFEDKNVIFNKERGTFVPSIKHSQGIYIKAENETLLRWGVNAMNRLGFRPENSEEKIASLTIMNANKIIYRGTDQTEVTFNSFEELTNTITELLS